MTAVNFSVLVAQLVAESSRFFPSDPHGATLERSRDDLVAEMTDRPSYTSRTVDTVDYAQ